MRLPLSLLLVLCASSQAEIRPFTEYDPAELSKAVPGLVALQPPQGELDPVLKAASKATEEMLVNFIAASSAEDVHEMRFDTWGTTAIAQQERFRYVTRYMVQNAEPVLEEIRLIPGTSRHTEPKTGGSYLVLDHFESLLDQLLPDYRSAASFRYAGTVADGDRKWHIVTFAQKPDAREFPSHIIGQGGAHVRLHGVLWIDAASSRVDRLYTAIAERPEGFTLTAVTTDIEFTPVTFAGIDGQLWLPAKITAHAWFPGGETHTVHRFSDYRTLDDDTLATRASGQSPSAKAAEDSWEVLARALTLPEARQGEAVPTLRDAIRLDPDLVKARFHLAENLFRSGDVAGAEAELRESVKRNPSAGPVRNLLGVTAFKRGDSNGAVEQFREAVKLMPKDAPAHFNLAMALERLGDRDGALAAYQEASALAPANTAIATRFETLKQKAPDTTIRVEVRQILVPAIVTDKDGHHVTGLKQSDFHVFEDGVEQKITAFSSETMNLPGVGELAATMPPPSSSAPAESKPTPRIRRRYLICIDTLHSGFGSFHSAHEALKKLFQSERPGDSQYALIALGRQYEVLQNFTTDPAEVLKVLEGSDFHKHFLGSQRSNAAGDLRDFRNDLDRARSACNARDPSCPSLKNMLPPAADMLAQQERSNTTFFLDQLRALVTQFAKSDGRKSVILLSDGFGLVPGKVAYELLVTYFPEMQKLSLRTVDRMQGEFDPVVRLAAKHSIAIDTIDSRGLYTDSSYSAEQGGSGAAIPGVSMALSQNDREAGMTLSEISGATGGRFYQNSNDLLRGLERAMADGREYYTIAYVPSNPKPDGKFHSITVKVDDKRATVRAKRGYWAE